MMDEKERREFEHDAAEHGIPAMLDRMGMDGLGNEVASLHKRIAELGGHQESQDDSVSYLEQIAEQRYQRIVDLEAALAERDRVLDEAARTIFTMECAYRGIFDEDEAVPVILADLRARCIE